MKEIINLHIGQAGVQLSNAVWELFAAEHDISIDGSIPKDGNEHFQGVDRLFYINSRDQALPRCILVDTEPTVIDEIRHGSYKQFFSSSNLLTGPEDSSSIFARGYFSQGRHYINEFLQKFNHQLEVSDSMQTLAFFHSLGGGTGSGLYSLILEELDHYTKAVKINISVHPSFSSSQIIVEPYNSILSEHYTIDETDISFMVDNEALFRLAHDQLLIQHPSYTCINRIVAQAFSLIISSSRYSENSCTITEILHNLVPFPRIHNPTCSLAPMKNPEQLHHSVNTIDCITRDGLSTKTQLLSCDPMEGEFMACCLMYKGNVNSGEVYEAIKKLKCHENLKFVDWCPTGIKVTLCSKCPSFIEKSGIGPTDRLLAVVSNNSAITDPLLHNTFRFQVLFQKRSFVHWYVGEGMEEDEFKDSLENLACLIKDYEECTLSFKFLSEIPAETSEALDYHDNSMIAHRKTQNIDNPMENEITTTIDTEDNQINELSKSHYAKLASFKSLGKSVENQNCNSRDNKFVSQVL